MFKKTADLAEYGSPKTHGLLILVQSMAAVLKAVSIKCRRIIFRRSSCELLHILAAAAAPPLVAHTSSCSWSVSFFFFIFLLGDHCPKIQFTTEAITSENPQVTTFQPMKKKEHYSLSRPYSGPMCTRVQRP